ncbi:MAG: alpha/beta fold hydrolase [Myxococcales bacterium]|nr:alpha/beta fold hydrolase [Myxococcales bacterium]
MRRLLLVLALFVFACGGQLPPDPSAPPTSTPPVANPDQPNKPSGTGQDPDRPQTPGVIGGDPDDTPAAAGGNGNNGNGNPTQPTAGGAPYPIVFAHGLFGFDKIGPISYWWNVLPELEKDGNKVFAAKMDPANDSVVRGKQLLAFVKKVLQDTGAAKVNIIGHSQGGFEARYVAAVEPNLVGAVVTVGTPHQGTKLADTILSKVKPAQVELLKAFFNLLGQAFFGEIAKHSDVEAAAKQLSTAGARDFNAKYPDSAGVSYYSVGGWTGILAQKPAAMCQSSIAPQFVMQFDKFKDTPDLNMLLTGLVIGQQPHDGVVELSSTKWGQWLGCVPADHMDQVGQMLGDQPGLGNGFNHIEFYRGMVKFLRSKGF